jgi:hypothetical protein
LACQLLFFYFNYQILNSICYKTFIFHKYIFLSFVNIMPMYCYLIFIWQSWGLNSGAHTCLVGALTFEPHPSSFCFSYFLERISWFFAQADSPTYAPHTCLGWTDISHCTQLISWDGASLSFCPSQPTTMFLLIAAYWVARIIGVNQHTWPQYAVSAEFLSLAFKILWKHFWCHL